MNSFQFGGIQASIKTSAQQKYDALTHTNELHMKEYELVYELLKLPSKTRMGLLESKRREGKPQHRAARRNRKGKGQRRSLGLEANRPTHVGHE